MLTTIGRGFQKSQVFLEHAIVIYILLHLGGYTTGPSSRDLQISKQHLCFIEMDLSSITKMHCLLPLDVTSNKRVFFLSVRWLHTHLH